MHNYPPILCIVHKYRRFAWADTTPQNRRAGRICLGKYVSRRFTNDIPNCFNGSAEPPRVPRAASTPTENPQIASNAVHKKREANSLPYYIVTTKT